MIELLLNGLSIDLTGNEDVALSYAASKLQDIQSRNGDFSTTFKVPLTNKVKQAIGFSNLFTSASTFPYRVAEAEIREQGVVVMKGFASVKAIDDYLNVFVFGGNTNWFDEIRDRFLQDLDYYNLDLVYNAAIVSANRLNNHTKKFLFPNIYFGGFANPSQPYDVSDFLPAIYAVDVFRKIFDEIGWTIESDIFENPDFLTEVILPTNPKWLRKNPGQVIKYTFDNPSYTTGSTGFDYPGVLKTVYDRLKLFTASNVWTTALASSSYFTVPSTGSFRVKGYFEFTDNGSASPIELRIGVFLAGALNPTSLQLLGTAYPTGLGLTTRIEFDKTFSIAGSTVNRHCFYFGSAAPNALLNLNGEVEITCQDTFYKEVQPEGLTDFAMALPENVSQIDFVKHILNEYCLIPKADPSTKVIKLFTFEELSKNKSKALNWTNKVDLKNAVQIIYKADDYGQKNLLEYKEDKNDLNLAYKQDAGSFEVSDLNLSPEKIVFQSVFSSLARGDVSGVELALIPSKLFKLNPKIGRIAITNSNLVTQWGQSAPTQSAEVFSINLQERIDEYYPTLLNSLALFKLLGIKVNLKPSDINQLDFSKPVFLDFTCDNLGHVSGYFYINLVDQYKPGAGETTKVEFVKI